MPPIKWFVVAEIVTELVAAGHPAFGGFFATTIEGETALRDMQDSPDGR